MDNFDNYYSGYYDKWNELLKDYNVKGINKEKNLDEFKESHKKKKEILEKKIATR